MGTNDAREQLETCKEEYTKLEAQSIEKDRKIFFLQEKVYQLLQAAGFNDTMINNIMEELK